MLIHTPLLNSRDLRGVELRELYPVLIEHILWEIYSNPSSFASVDGVDGSLCFSSNLGTAAEGIVTRSCTPTRTTWLDEFSVNLFWIVVGRLSAMT